ncbi:MAG: EutN/CcmL family microcompartment protein [Nocardioidaceae bacterium]
MLRGVVTGNVWSTKRIEGLPSGALLDVLVDGSEQKIVAFDVLGSGVGERVLVARGSVAAAWFPGKPPPIDALIIGSIDEPADSGSTVSPAQKTAQKTTQRTARKATRKTAPATKTNH